MTPIRTALISCSDKTGIVPLAKTLVSRHVKLVSTGGTASALREAGLPVTDVTEVTGHPEAFGGRMKTISFAIASGILFDRDRDRQEAERIGILPIDLVIANLYPFAQHKDSLPLHELIEHIDIGGPTMIRAAAKNAKHVTVVVSPSDYTALQQELEQNGGCTTLPFRERMMATAFSLTATYDRMICDRIGQLTLHDTHAKNEVALRYGENPHQAAVFRPGSDISIEVLGGKEISYNNLVDLDAALACVIPLDDSACAIVKHENPCGLATSQDPSALLEMAWAGDPVSAFGSVIAFNRGVTRKELEFLQMDDKAQRKFVEIVAAPSFAEDALAFLAQNKNLRPVSFVAKTKYPAKTWRTLRTGVLEQDADQELFREFVGETTALDIPLALFALHACRALKSNAIAIARRQRTGLSLLGMGAGQPNRKKSTELAVAQARENIEREGESPETVMSSAVLASDAFFPFADAVEIALRAGIRTILQPGGSIRDAEVKAVCDGAGAQLILTGMRHFKH